MTLVSVRELGVPERLGLTFADELPPPAAWQAEQGGGGRCGQLLSD